MDASDGTVTVNLIPVIDEVLARKHWPGTSAVGKLLNSNRDAGQWAARKTWYDLYEVIANSRDALKAIEGRSDPGKTCFWMKSTPSRKAS